MIDACLGDSVDTILTRLTETIQWCGARVDVMNPKSCLRSSSLRPNPLAGTRKSVVETVASSRYAKLGHPKKKRSNSLSGGRLLIYEPDLSLSHGIEEAETEGFVDIDNIPPWDSWVAYVHEDAGSNYLLSWVPGEFVTLVEQGIRVSPDDCFDWVESQPRLVRLLEDANLPVSPSRP